MDEAGAAGAAAGNQRVQGEGGMDSLFWRVLRPRVLPGRPGPSE